jgi:hypothetical protein
MRPFRLLDAEMLQDGDGCPEHGSVTAKGTAFHELTLPTCLCTSEQILGFFKSRHGRPSNAHRQDSHVTFAP